MYPWFSPRKMCTKIFVKWGGLISENLTIFSTDLHWGQNGVNFITPSENWPCYPNQSNISNPFSIPDFYTTTYVTTLYERFVSYCNVPRCKVEGPLEHANSSLLCMLFEFPFDTVRSTDEWMIPWGKQLAWS